MADIEQRSITREQQRQNFTAQRFLYHAASGTWGRIRKVAIAAGIPQFVIRRRLRRGWSAYDAVNTPYVAGPDELLRSMIHYWRLNESSGTRVATFGNVNLLPYGSIDSVVGKNGNAASFEETEFLASESGILITRPITIAFWIYVPTNLPFPEGDRVFSYGNNSVTVNEDGIVYFLSGVHLDGAGEVLTTFSLDQWDFLVFTVSSSGQIKASSNGSQFAYGTVVTTPATGSAELRTGSLYSPGCFCKIDSLMLFNRDITQAEVARLYNSGAGYFP